MILTSHFIMSLRVMDKLACCPVRNEQLPRQWKGGQAIQVTIYTNTICNCNPNSMGPANFVITGLCKLVRVNNFDKVSENWYFIDDILQSNTRERERKFLKDVKDTSGFLIILFRTYFQILNSKLYVLRNCKLFLPAMKWFLEWTVIMTINVKIESGHSRSAKFHSSNNKKD